MRDGMWNLVSRVRALAAAGTADYTIAGESYWTNDHVQEALDRNSRRVVREPLQNIAEWRGAGSAVWFDYYWKLPMVEEANSGTTIWSVQDGAGSVIGTANYSVNYDQRKITFTTDQRGEERYLTYTAYDVHSAAADIWDDKAGQVAASYDVASDNHDLKRSQMYRAYREQANQLRKRSQYGGKISAGAATMYRGDMP